ncbi:MAG: M48 family metallopeptidase [Muribaculaceae bacterium]|jgi:predicted Zn-dependent protease|nr:M48 family metallopeptidase [Muribaculaceae bacterium]
MKKIIAMLAVAAMLLTSCGSVPITGRKQLNLVSDQEVLAASLQQYASFMQTATISNQKAQSAQVTRVGQRIAAATEAYLKYAGLESELQNFAWEFNLVKSDEVNAWCMPGGKIVVYEGIMNLVGSDDELAVVIGHEVAHAVAKHSNERMSQQVLAEYGANAIGIFTSGKSAATQQIAQQVYGLGAQYGVMQPFSRKHESEADKMGLVLMTIAGYNPDTAVTFWQKMAATTTQEPPEFMSSHPSHATRIADIKKWLPEVKKQYGSKQ